MTHQLDVAGGRDIVARWCTLAEQRLEYLTELFETGRWRRFHTELSFLENIQEAKAAVDIWRDLSREPSAGSSAGSVSWSGRTWSSLPHEGTPQNELKELQRQPTAIPSAPAPAAISIVPQNRSLGSQVVPSARVVDPGSELTRTMNSIADRYPLLRNDFKV
jgi:uncharacterized repeat protein (TIGR03809 family)